MRQFNKTQFDIQLSEHFKLSEFVQTSYADFQMLDIKQFDNIRTLVTIFLEPLRSRLGVPIFINSGFRGELVNEIVGGVKNSLHKKGLACDISSVDLSPSELYHALQELIRESYLTPSDVELIKYPTFVHIGIDCPLLFD